MEIRDFVDVDQMKRVEKELRRFLMTYGFALKEVETKIDILNDEFHYIHDYNPIEHVKTRVKSPESILEKLTRNNLDLSLESIKEDIKDIAGIRIVCSFVSDIYVVADMLAKLEGIKIIQYKDYIKEPKANGYQSLHLIMQVPVSLSDRVEEVYVEVQLRTVGMDFWASLEHKIYYKYDKEIPSGLTRELSQAARIVSELDRKMEFLNREVTKIKNSQEGEKNSLIENN